MNSFSHQQVEEILDRATLKSANLTPDDLLEVARQSSIPAWCVQEAIVEVAAQPSPNQDAQRPRNGRGGATSFSAGSRSPSSSCSFRCPGLVLTGLTIVVATVSSVLVGESQLRNYDDYAQPALEAAANTSTTSTAVVELDVAIGWFESQAAKDDRATPPEVNAAFAQLKTLSRTLDERKSPSLDAIDQKAIAATAAIIDDGYQSISAASQIQRMFDLIASLLIFGGCSFYLGLALARHSANRLALINSMKNDEEHEPSSLA